MFGNVSPVHSYVQKAGQFGSMVSKEGVKFLSPKLIERATIATIGKSVLAGSLGAVAVPVLSPVITPIAAYGASVLASHVITVIGNKVYEAVTQPSEPLVPLVVEKQKGLIESVGPGMFANGLVKGLEFAAEGTAMGPAISLVKPFAVPLVAEAVSGVAKHLFVG